LTTPSPNAKNCQPARHRTPGRHHVGTPGDIISECPGDFVGIRMMIARGAYQVAARVYPEDLIEVRHRARVIEKSK
jgi:hypothetical protein